MYIMCSGFSCASDTHGRSSGVERSATVLSRGFQWLLGDKTGLLSPVFPAVKIKLFWAAFVPPAWSKATPICLQLNKNVPRWEANCLTCLGLKQPPPHPTHKALNQRVWTDQSPGRERWNEVQVKCAGLVWLLLLLKCHNVSGELERAALSRCSRACWDSPEFTSPVFCVGCTQHEKEWKRKGLMGRRLPLDDTQILPSPCSAQEQRRALQRPGLPRTSRSFVSTRPGPQPPRLGPYCPSPSSSPPSFLAFHLLGLSLMLALIFTDIKEPFLFSMTLKESKWFMLLGGILPIHLTPARLPDPYLNPQSWYPQSLVQALCSINACWLTEFIHEWMDEQANEWINKPTCQSCDVTSLCRWQFLQPF